jgi:hypothetical protein
MGYHVGRQEEKEEVVKRKKLHRRYGHAGRSSRVFVQEVRPHVKLYRDPKTGIAWIEDGTSGTGTSAHPSIHSSGSVRGMKDRGWWGKKDRTVRSHGFIYNIDHAVGVRTPDDELVRNMCECGGNHGGGR